MRLKRKYITIVVLALLTLLFATKSNAQKLDYSPKWYGPNASPVPIVPSSIANSVNITANSLFNKGKFGDRSLSIFTDIEVPLIKEKASFRVYGYVAEDFNWSEEDLHKREIAKENQKGFIFGDLYVQTRMRILSEGKFWPNLTLNATLKTASPKGNKHKRYFDTPGYFFLLEYNKSLYQNKVSSWLNKIAVYGYLGFLCWETTGSLQNDAPTYSFNTEITNKYMNLSVGIGGYNGWMTKKYGQELGDNLFIYTTKLRINIYPKIALNMIFEKGINDYLYSNFGFGLTFSLK